MAFVEGVKVPSPPSTRLRKLEFALFKKSAALVAGSRVFAAVSGGADSVAMLMVLDRVRARREGFSLEVVHVHHGDSQDEKQTRFRDRAAGKVARLASELELPFHLLRVESRPKSKGSRTGSESESEEVLRDARYRVLKKTIEKLSNGEESPRVLVAMAHHADDLFETRLIRLLRGTGPSGLRAMSEFSRSGEGLEIWRPFLSTSRQEILEYLEDLEFRKHREWVEDPSNRDARYLRTRVRHSLIPRIESTREGGAGAMARSLEILSEASAATDAEREPLVLDRKKLLSLPQAERRQCLATWARRSGIRDLSRRQFDEILRRIDTPQKRLSFEVGGRVWSVEKTIETRPRVSK